MSRKGNRGQSRRRQQTPPPTLQPTLYECPKHGVQRQPGIQYRGNVVCIDCMMALFEKECGFMLELGAKADEPSRD